MTEFADLEISTNADVAIVRLNRPQKRNAIRDATIEELGSIFSRPANDIRAVLLVAAGENFSAGLDLTEHQDRDAAAVMHHSQMWHRVLNVVQTGGLPVVSVLKGAVIGGGLEIACATHIRVAERGSYYALPEAMRGIFVGGGATVRVARIVGMERMIEMMLTGRTYDTEAGQSLGLSHYVVEQGEGEKFGLDLAHRVAKNAPLSNYAIMNAIPRIADMSAADGLFTESLMAAVVQTGDDARARLADFLERRAPRVLPENTVVQAR